MAFDDLVDPARALDHFADGATIVLQSLQRWWPPLGRFCRDLELVLGHQVQCNAYLTPAGAAGLAPHHDTHDVFVLQVAGTKHWDLRTPMLEAPLARHRSDQARAAEQPVVRQIDLRPGDCLYLPRGWIHSATAQEAPSLHLTIGVLAVTAHDVLRRIVERAADEPAFRRTLPPGVTLGAGQEAAAVVKAIVAELQDWLGGVDAGDVGTEVRDAFWSRRRPLLDGQLLELASLDAIDDETVVVRRGGTAHDLHVAGGALAVRAGDRRVTLPAALAPVVERLLDGAPHRVGDLADAMDGASRLVLARRLVRDGLLRRVDGA
jgi:hypothetical protein